MLFSLATPADHVRGPQYLSAALTALHRSFRGGAPWELVVGRPGEQVGLYTRAAAKFAPLVQGQLQGAYPDLRMDRLSDDVFAPTANETCYWARLRLVPSAVPLVAWEQWIDRQEHRLVDPIAGLLAALALRKGAAVRPSVSLLVRPAGRFAKRRLRRNPTQQRDGPTWTVDVRLVVLAPSEDRDSAVAKIHELAASFQHVLQPGRGGCELSRIRRGSVPRRVSLFRSWLVSPAELALLWHPPTASVQTPQLRTNDSREFEPPPGDRLPMLPKYPHLAVLGRTAFRQRRDVFGMLPEDRFRHLYLIGQTGTGKSTLLLNLAAADIAAGRSVVLLDPHGDLCEHLSAIVPRRRTNDVILFDPSGPRAARSDAEVRGEAGAVAAPRSHFAADVRSAGPDRGRAPRLRAAADYALGTAGRRVARDRRAVGRSR